MKDVSVSNHCDLVPDKQQKIDGWTSSNRFIFSTTVISLHAYEIMNLATCTGVLKVTSFIHDVLMSANVLYGSCHQVSPLSMSSGL